MKFQVADWYVDTDANRIHNGGQDIKLESKVMALLTYLARNQGQVVSREQLEADVWTDRVISYDALTSCITRLRKVLGDDSRKPLYIETVPKKGYRLIAAVRWESAPQTAGQHNHSVPASSRSQHFRIIAALVLLLMFAVAGGLFVSSLQEETERTAEFTEAPSVLVLPFENLSNEDAQAYFSDGITADISISLAKLSGLQVIAPSSLLSEINGYNRGGVADDQKLARYVLTGSVQRDANKLRVNAALLDNRSHQHLWAESYDRELTDVFEVQDDITAKIVSALSIRLTEEEKNRVARRYTISVAAYDQFLRGQALYTQHAHDENLGAREHLLRAIQLDPNFARAYATLALTYVDEYRYQWSSAVEEPLLKTLSLAQKAVSIDDRLPQSYWALAYAQLHLHHYAEAIEAVNQALSVQPNYADGYAILALIYIYQGNAGEGIDNIRRAMRLNPDYPAQYISVLGQAHYYLEEYDSAALVLRNAIDKNYSLLTAHIMLTATLSSSGMVDEANWSAAQLRAISPAFTVQDVARIFPVSDEKRLRGIMEQLHSAGLR